MAIPVEGERLAQTASSGRLVTPLPARCKRQPVNEAVRSPVMPVDTPTPKAAVGCRDHFELVDEDGLTLLPANTEGLGEATRDIDLWKDLCRGMPSWLVSLVFHLALILVLAIASFSITEKTAIFFEVGSLDSSVDLNQFELVFDEPMDSGELTTDLIDSLDQQPLSAASTELFELPSEATADGVPMTGDSLGPEAISGTGIESKPGKLKDGTQFFGISEKGHRFVFVIDCSGSMNQGPHYATRWEMAVRELRDSITRLTNEQEFLILLYNFDAIPMNQPAQLLPATEINKKKALRWLDQQIPMGGTFCRNALFIALSQKPDAIFLLSDGELEEQFLLFQDLEMLNPSEKKMRHRQGESTSTMDYRQVPIHTIALGAALGSRTLKAVSDKNNGIFTQSER